MMKIPHNEIQYLVDAPSFEEARNLEKRILDNKAIIGCSSLRFEIIKGRIASREIHDFFLDAIEEEKENFFGVENFYDFTNSSTRLIRKRVKNKMSRVMTNLLDIYFSDRFELTKLWFDKNNDIDAELLETIREYKDYCVLMNEK